MLYHKWRKFQYTKIMSLSPSHDQLEVARLFESWSKSEPSTSAWLNRAKFFVRIFILYLSLDASKAFHARPWSDYNLLSLKVTKYPQGPDWPVRMPGYFP